MTIQLSVSLRNARANAFAAAIGPSPVLRLRSGAPPSNCGSADAGTALWSKTLSTAWLAAASSGLVAFNDVPLSTSAAAQGTIGHYRLYAADGVTCHKQGTVTLSTGGGDLTVDNVAVNVGQIVNVNSWSITEPSA